MKTNAARILDSLDVAYSLREYEVDVNDLTAATVARKIGLPLEQVFKTLVVSIYSSSGPNDYVFAVIPGNAELDLKKLAGAAGSRKAVMAALKDVEPLTGYVRGGVTVLGARKAFSAFADESAELYDVISVSAGQRGMQLLLSPSDYLRVTGATVADLTKEAGRP